MNSYTVNVEKFGKIRKASIDIAPFMFFVGDNNSGKSYLMQLLWGLYNTETILFAEAQELPAYNELREIILEQIANEFDEDKPTFKYKFVPTSDFISKVIEYINQSLDKNKSSIAKTVLNTDTMSVGKFYISNFSTSKKYPFTVIRDYGTIKLGTPSVTVSITDSYDSSKDNNLAVLLNAMIVLYAKHLIFDGIKHIRYYSKTIDSMVFLPASRTGFMLTYKDLQRYMFEFLNSNEVSSINNNSRNKYPLVVNRFITDLASLEPAKDYSRIGNRMDVVKYIENEIYDGKLSSSKSESVDYSYIRSSSTKPISMYLTSSMITEVAPLLIYLKSNNTFNTIIIEEPEAHLHLKAQRKLLSALTMLKNAGINIWFTTHSDSMMQEVSNLIKLKNKLSFVDKEDSTNNSMSMIALDYLDVKGYQFDINNKLTDVSSVKISEVGVTAKTFIDELLNQIEFESSINDLKKGGQVE